MLAGVRRLLKQVWGVGGAVPPHYDLPSEMMTELTTVNHRGPQPNLCGLRKHVPAVCAYFVRGALQSENRKCRQCGKIFAAKEEAGQFKLL